MEDFLTIKEFAKKVHYDPRQIRQMCIEGQIKAQKLSDKSRKWLIPESEVAKIRGELKSDTQTGVLEKQGQQVHNIVITKNKEEHFQHLVEITNLLLGNEVGKVLESVSNNGTPESTSYTIISEETNFEDIPHDYLVERIDHNIEHICKTFNAWDFWECFVPHLLAESSRYTDFSKLYDEHTIEFINLLRMLAQRKTFKGNCPVCEDWS